MLQSTTDLISSASQTQLPPTNRRTDLEVTLEFVDNLVFEQTGKYLSTLQRAVFRASWSGQNQSYHEIAKAYGYSANYLKQDVGPKLWKLLSEILGEKVSKSNFQAILERQSSVRVAALTQASTVSNTLQLQQKPARNLHFAKSEGQVAKPHQDCAEVSDVSVFCGRTQDLATLEQWIVKDRCQPIALSNIGGIGKTALAVSCVQQIQQEFEFVIWRSLRHAPSLTEFLASAIGFLNEGQPTDLPADISSQISQLVNYLHAHRCLIVLDGVEAIFKNGDRSGQYLEGYEGYGELLEKIGTTPHQSAIVLTSWKGVVRSRLKIK